MALITELREELECEVKLDGDVVIRISANWVSVRETNSPVKPYTFEKRLIGNLIDTASLFQVRCCPIYDV